MEAERQPLLQGYNLKFIELGEIVSPQKESFYIPPIENRDIPEKKSTPGYKSIYENNEYVPKEYIVKEYKSMYD